MKKLKDLDLSELLDYMAAQTSIYTQLISKGGSAEELAAGKKILSELHSEIKRRRKEME